MQRTKLYPSIVLFALGCAGDDAPANDDSSDGSTSTTTTATNATGSTTLGSASVTTAATLGSTGEDGTSGGPLPTAPPALGVQLDRIGRPLVSTALLERWQISDAAHDTAADVYNGDPSPTGWPDVFWAQLHLALGVFDSLDNVSGNTLQYDTGGPTPCDNTSTHDCYQTVARLLANDWILVRRDTNQGVRYLGIEEELLGATATATARGGRRPEDDVVDRTYTILANTNLTDNVDAPATAQVAEFPFLADPN